MKMNKTGITILNIVGGILTCVFCIAVLPVYIFGLLIFLVYKAIRTILGKDKKKSGPHKINNCNRSKEEIYKDNEWQQKIEHRELTTEGLEHTVPKPDEPFFFYDKRCFNLPHGTIAYVETIPDEKLHKFFGTEKSWLDKFTDKWGLKIVNVNIDDVRKDMFFPQDADVFRHGILWNTEYSTNEEEYGLIGSVHFYYDIDTNSEVPIKEQLKSIAHKIYDDRMNKR